MKFSCIFVVTFWCTLYISEKSTAEMDENFDNLPISRDDPAANRPAVEAFTGIIENISEPHISDMMQRKGKKAKYIRNCLDLKYQGKPSGIYHITPCDDNPTKLVKVYCDMDTDGGGWTVIQRRGNYAQQQDFYNTWSEYMVGFGHVSRDFWLGNDNIHCLTKQTHNEIRFDLGDWGGNTTYANYRFFYIADEANLYKLDVQDYTGTAGDSFNYHNYMNFSTYNADHDADSRRNCSGLNKGGWWYKSCFHSNLNGVYNGTRYTGLVWYTWKGWSYLLKNTEMKIRPNDY